VTRDDVCVRLCVCVCMCLTNVSCTAHPSVHALTCPERRTHQDTPHALASSPKARRHRGTQPQHKPGSTPSHWRRQQLPLLRSWNAATRASTTHPATTRTPPPPRGSAQPVKTPVKHPPTKPEFKSTTTHALRPSGRPPPKPSNTRRQHTQTRRRRARRRNDNNTTIHAATTTTTHTHTHTHTHASSRQTSPTCRVFPGGMSRDS
jgi:hypothetical protein